MNSLTRRTKEARRNNKENIRIRNIRKENFINLKTTMRGARVLRIRDIQIKEHLEECIGIVNSYTFFFI